MIESDRPVVRHFTIRYDVPPLTYLRLRCYAQRYHYPIKEACIRLLDLGLDQFAIPREPELLLGSPEGRDD